MLVKCPNKWAAHSQKDTDVLKRLFSKLTESYRTTNPLLVFLSTHKYLIKTERAIRNDILDDSTAPHLKNNNIAMFLKKKILSQQKAQRTTFMLAIK